MSSDLRSSAVALAMPHKQYRDNEISCTRTVAMNVLVAHVLVEKFLAGAGATLSRGACFSELLQAQDRRLDVGVVKGVAWMRNCSGFCSAGEAGLLGTRNVAGFRTATWFPS